MDDIGRRIRHWRTQAGISATELAGKLGVSPAAVSQWEAGSSDPAVARLSAIAEACGVSLRIFVGDIPPEVATEPETADV